ncbi:hypothetical protein OI18_21540 [Flavihumibacter solisilvae]|uniref:Ig-like domain-containing protein n=1 Tax=Flavihumibacter solisilvae TaxID=1349421 RepID=A0A0C1IQF2_9BACT|nr:hypothetical protein OI18_21540 [Flavihumibacter solisilvae]
MNLVVNEILTSTANVTICTSQLPYSWNSEIYTTAGTYTVPLVSAAGCDSIATLNLVVNETLTSTTDVVICASQLPYSWNGETYTTAGTYERTFVSAAGCDSIATLNLVVNETLTSITNATICASQLPYSWNGETYTTAGTYERTFVSAAGCDSIATLNLVVNETLTSTTNATICTSQLPYSWNRNTYSEAGTYEVKLTSTAGCDSIATLILTVNTVLTSTTNLTFCSNQLPFNWNGTSISEAGTYQVKLTSSAGCDSIVTLILGVYPEFIPSVVVSDASCIAASGSVVVTSPAQGNGIRYSIDGINFQDENIFRGLIPGDYIVTVVNANGCNATKSVTVGQQNTTITINQKVVDAVCTTSNGTIDLIVNGNGTSPYQYKWSGPGGFTATTEDLSNLEAGDYAVTVTDANGCTALAKITVGHLITTTTLNYRAQDVSCTSNGSIDLIVNGNGSAPYEYRWTGPAGFNATTEDLNNIPAGTYSVVVTDANGCTALGSFTISQSQDNVSLITHPVTTCTVADLTTSAVTLGSEPGLQYSYWTNEAATVPLSNPNFITSAGTYYIKATNAAGCSSIQPVVVSIVASPALQISNPPAVCSPGTVDLTNPSVTSGSDAGLTFTYWTNQSATNPLNNPQSIGTAGTYYIKATTVDGCFNIKPVNVSFLTSASTFVVTNPAQVCAPATIDLTSPAITAGSDPGLTYTYWADAANTIPLQNPAAISESGTYYIKASSQSGCSFTKSVKVDITVIKEVQAIRYPTVFAEANVPLQLTARDLGNNMTYQWMPPVGLNTPSSRTPIFRYNQATEYRIRITTGGGCQIVDTLMVRIRQTPTECKSDLFVPKAWSPNADGHNDRLYPLTVCIKELKYFRVFNRWGKLLFETNVIGSGWDGIFNGQPQIMDAYTWTVEAVGMDGSIIKRSGNSVLLR